MPVDRTYLFKASGRMLHMKGLNSKSAQDNDKGKPSTSNAYKTLINEALKVNSSMHDFYLSVVEKRKDYMTYNSPIMTMLEADRVEFEKTGSALLSMLLQQIKCIRSSAQSDQMCSSEQEHLLLVCASLESHWKDIRTLFIDLRTVRAKFLKIKPAVARLSGLVGSSRNRNDRESPDLPGMRRRTKPSTGLKRISSKRDISSRNKEVGFAEDYQKESDDFRLSEREHAQLSVENDSLFEKLTDKQRDVQNLEDQIFAIQNLQDALAEKINIQAQAIDAADELAMHTNMAMDAGNEWIRKTLASSAGRRIFMLFSLIVVTFSLLFIDWYNP